jgi:putative sterol carrier protein
VTWGLKGTPNVTVRCGDEDLLLIATGKKDPKMAAFTGALVFEPLDLALAEQIGQLLA